MTLSKGLEHHRNCGGRLQITLSKGHKHCNNCREGLQMTLVKGREHHKNCWYMEAKGGQNHFGKWPGSIREGDPFRALSLRQITPP